MTSAQRGEPAGGVPLSPLHLRPHPWAGQGLRAAGRVSKDLSGPTAPSPPPWPSSDLITCKCLILALLHGAAGIILHRRHWDPIMPWLVGLW